MSNKRKIDFDAVTKDILSNKEFIKLKTEIHHNISRYDHCLHVAKNTFRICKFFNINYEEATRAALLHDFFSNEETDSLKTLNRYQSHPYIAYLNSNKHFVISEKQKDAIICHMWPWTLCIPKYKESWVVTVADKLVSINEWYNFRLSFAICIWILFIFNIFTITIQN